MNIEYRCKCGNKLEVDQVKPRSYGYDVEVILEQCEACASKQNLQSAKGAPAQAAIIKRLADALEALEMYISLAASGADVHWHIVNADEGKAARALLAEIRGKDA